MPKAPPKTINIIHIEDDDLDAEFFNNLLNKLSIYSCKTRRFTLLSDAITALDQDDYDLIMLDLDLPDSKGLETVNAIRQCAPHIALTVLCSNQDELFGEQIIQLGADDYFPKNEANTGLLARSIRYAIDRKQYQMKLESLVLSDTLTGVCTRIIFEDRLQQAIQRARRNKTVFALFFVDIDSFKAINDQQGRKTGDSVLIETAKRLENSVRKQDTVARLEGDQFVMILEDVQSELIATTVAEKVLKSFIPPFIHNDFEFNVKASIGVSLYTEKDECTAKQLLHHADQAMYAAKRNGGNLIVCFNASRELPRPLTSST